MRACESGLDKKAARRAELALMSRISVNDFWEGECGAVILCRGNGSYVVRVANWPTKFEKITELRVW